MADEVPGMFINIAGIPLPKDPPVNIAVKNSMASRKLMYSVAGKKIAIAIEICRPGIAPNTSPMMMPGNTYSHGPIEENSSSLPAAIAEKSNIGSS
jgi:hypothetical protein